MRGSCLPFKLFRTTGCFLLDSDKRYGTIGRSKPAWPLNDAHWRVFFCGVIEGVMKYGKPWLSFEDQAEQLIIQRGMIADREVLIDHLRKVGYYRLSGYWHIFKSSSLRVGDEDEERFAEGTTFDKVWGLYVFDRQFRLVVLDAIERVEVYIRTQLAHMLSEITGPFGYLDHAGLPKLSDEEYESFIKRCAEEYERSREPFALHYKEKYGGDDPLPPYWILVNLMDFGTMLRLYTGASPDVRNRIAGRLGVSSRVLKSWLVALNTTRNICAHHGRLWNRGIGTRPVIPTKTKYPEWHEPFPVRSDNMFGILTILSYLLEYAAPETSWRGRLFSLLDGRSSDELSRMGFKEGWRDCPIWARWV